MNSGPHLSKKFAFIAIDRPGKCQDKEKHRFARAHAMKQSGFASREKARRNQENFRVTTVAQLKTQNGRRRGKSSLPRSPTPISPLSPSNIDPFDSLVVPTDRLQTLITHRLAQHAGEPIFTMNGSAPFRSLSSVFRCGLEDPVLCHGVLMTLCFSANGYEWDAESLYHKGETLRWISQRLSDPKDVVKESTVGAILMLTNVEYRLRNGQAVQLHLEALNKILHSLARYKTSLTDGIKRALFWQDLDGALMTGSTRVFDHSTFPELHWSRDSFRPSLYTLPPGLDSKRQFLTCGLIQACEDLHAFQIDADCSTDGNRDTVESLHLDTQQAWLESRLFHIREEARSVSPVTECIAVAAYLCAYTLYTEIWGGKLVPPFLSKTLLQLMIDSQYHWSWTSCPDLLLWLAYLGCICADSPEVRQEYVAVLRVARFARPSFFSVSWEQTRECLSSFIWSDKTFGRKCKDLFEEVRKS